VKVLLLNEQNELLLLCADDPTTTSAEGKYHGSFWFPVGGQIEKGESLEEAALREIYEETGIKKEEVSLGSVVWHGSFDLKLNGILTHLDQTFIVAKTKKKEIFLQQPTEWEKNTIKKLDWFSLSRIKKGREIIYPVVLGEYLPDILAGKYPPSPLEIDLAKQPKK
jgi:8-oxo-dGTP pyrophosphatase MutT (NUDIX family)